MFNHLTLYKQMTVLNWAICVELQYLKPFNYVQINKLWLV